jgi:hypothetical protein
MEKVTLNILFEAKVNVRQRNIKLQGVNAQWTYEDTHKIGYFADDKLAVKAIRLYEHALRGKNIGTPIGNCIEKKIFKEGNTPDYYKDLNDFINRNGKVSHYDIMLGASGMKKVVAEIDGRKIFNENQERLIEKMIMDYKRQIKIRKDVKEFCPLVKRDKEIVKFLEDLRDGKIEL